MLVSVIIPVYNVEDYVEKCLKSVLNQTYNNIEIIVVDDCGTDGSMGIVERIVEEYQGNKSIKILHHKSNRGLSAARNTGLLESNGDYVFFLDSDDTISENALSVLTGYIIKDASVDMVIGNYRSNGQMFSLLNLSDGYYQGDILRLYCEKKFYTMAWNKLVRRTLLLDHELFFEEGLIHEDNLWSFIVACHLNKIAICNISTYNYLIRPNSIQQEKDANVKHLSAYQKVAELMTIYAHKSGTIKNPIVFSFVDTNQYTFLTYPLWANLPDLSYRFYHVLRSLPRLSIYQMFKFGKGFKEKLSFLHYFLPESLGFKWYIKMRNA